MRGLAVAAPSAQPRAQAGPHCPGAQGRHLDTLREQQGERHLVGSKDQSAAGCPAENGRLDAPKAEILHHVDLNDVGAGNLHFNVNFEQQAVHDGPGITARMEGAVLGCDADDRSPPQRHHHVPASNRIVMLRRDRSARGAEPRTADRRAPRGQHRQCQEHRHRSASHCSLLTCRLQARVHSAMRAR